MKKRKEYTGMKGKIIVFPNANEATKTYTAGKTLTELENRRLNEQKKS